MLMKNESHKIDIVPNIAEIVQIGTATFFCMKTSENKQQNFRQIQTNIIFKGNTHAQLQDATTMSTRYYGRYYGTTSSQHDEQDGCNIWYSPRHHGIFRMVAMHAKTSIHHTGSVLVFVHTCFTFSSTYIHTFCLWSKW
jgi:hypothetical protein